MGTQKSSGETFMERLAAFIVAKRNLFFLLVILGIIFSAFSVNWVEVENDLVYYLPSDSETKIGLEIMEDNFTTLGTANVMVANITYEKALEYVEDISEVEGVQSVAFDNTSAHYQNASALYTVSFAYDQYDVKCENALNDVKEVLAGQDIYIGSDIGYYLPDIIANEVKVIMIYVAVIIIFVLLLTSQTFAEIPVLLLTFIVAAVLNMGTNFIMGKISFVSNSVTTVLQLALSLDYAVIFCNRYKEEHKALPTKEATIKALSKAIPEILSSSMTTIGGLAAMVFMQFKIGPDMGINLIKSIFFALLSVFVVMPGLLVLFGPLMDKTRHKNYIPEIPFVGKFAHATRYIIPPIFAVVLVVACILSGKCPYVYGYSKLETAKLNEKKIAENMIADNFTSTETVALVMPAGNYQAEGEILDALNGYEEVTTAMGLANVEAMGGYVLSDSLNPREFAELADLDYELAQIVYMAYAAEQGDYEKMIGSITTYEIPLIDIFLFVCDQIDSGLVSLGEEQQAMLAMAQTQMESAKLQLQSENYSRVLIQLDIPEGGNTLYAFLDTIRATAGQYYPEGEVYVVGNPTSEYDFQKTFSKDNIVIGVLTIVIVLGVLLFTFKSVGMPILLIMVIQGSIWINFSVPAITDSGVFFMTYLIVSAIQMGANIDYAIVIASRFMELKDKMPLKQAMMETMNFAFPTIVISGTILATASFFIGNMTSEGSIANMGMNLARGTLISIALVMFVLPQLLLIGVKIIDKTSFSMPAIVPKKEEKDKKSMELSAIILSLVLAGTFIFSVQTSDAPLILTAEASDITLVQEETIKIKDAEDLLAFAENCVLDTWSQGKTVILQADIYLEDVDFLPIPTFGGTFDGKGHSINGMHIDASVSPAGLFSVIQEGAVVKNMNVNGSVEPSGINSAAGGIAGENYGDIINCTFTGMVSGEEHIGGIAGVNEATGTIKNCRVNGKVLGENMTGGICGYNLGAVLKCNNDASVNNVSVDPTISMDDLSLDISMDVTRLKNKNLLNVASDSGGICGYSIGTIEDCTNTGTIGYPHIGYNLGGIAGRSSGFVANSTNSGEIYGRKDVGGLIGQMEPYIHVSLSASGIAEIGQEVKGLGNALEQAESSAEQGSVSVQKRIQRINLYLKEIQETLKDSSENGLDSSSTAKLYAEMSILKKQLELLTKESAGTVGTLGKNLKNIGEHADSLSDTFKGVMEAAEGLALSDFVADISEVNLEEATLGKVTKSKNTGTVYGDIHVGGIVGTISLEYDIDPEDDLTADFSIQERRQYELSAIIYHCKNTAIVSAKKNYAGGIVGRMDLGLVSDCEAYGTIFSESGDYVGGIAGLTGSTIQNSYAKCSLAGRNYIGGIVGSGITESATGESSTVRDCYSFVDVAGYQQFAGAIAGVDAGDYLECYFVSEDLAGINRTSYEGKAEPITYKELLKVAGLPDEFETFTLTFFMGEEVVYTTTFEYGDSFGEDIFPTLPKGKDMYAQWDTTSLKNLKKDTVVRAVYSNYTATLASTEVRRDGRAVFLAEGRYDADDVMCAEQKEADFVLEDLSLLDRLNKYSTLEQWTVSLPEDGVLVHTLRYLPEEPGRDNLTLYVKQDGIWKQVSEHVVGSYLLANIAGTEAEIAVVETTELWWIWAVSAVVIVGMIGGVIYMVRKKKNILKWVMWSLAAVLIVLAALVIAVLLKGKLTNGVKAYQLLKAYAEQPEISMKLHIDAKLDGEELDMTANVRCTDLEGHQVTCLEQSGVSFFYADGTLFLENGKAYRASEVSADYAELLDYTVLLYQELDMETLKSEHANTYRITVKEDSRQELLQYLLPEYVDAELDISKMQMDVLEENETLQSITFSSRGKLFDGAKKDFDITATLEAADDAEVIEIPEAVKTAILSGAAEAEEIITEDIFRLYAGWKDLYSRNPLGMEIYLHADCGPLALDEEVTFITAKQDGLRVNCVQKNDYSVFFTEDKICSEKGYSVTTQRAQAIQAADLIGLAYEMFLNGTFSCTEVDDTYIYSIALDEASMKQIAEDIAKESTEMPVQFENGSVQVHIQDKKVQSIRFVCDGSVNILITDVAVAFSAELNISGAEKYESFVIPDKVLETLGK